MHAHLTRRQWLGATAAAALPWLTPAAELLARQSRPKGRPARSLILLWLAGGPSQLETFDPHPGTKIGGPTRAISTRAPGVQIAAALERTAELMDRVALVRSVRSEEGDHERGTYMVKTGYRPNPTVNHPSIGAICCYALPEEVPGLGRTEIPRHVSILPNQWPGRGGDLGNQYDAFLTYDPLRPVPDVKARVNPKRFRRRLAGLEHLNRGFGRRRPVQARRTLDQTLLDQAVQMMTSEQLAAFDVTQEPLSVRRRYGETPFGRGCLAARRLIEVSVRCVEVTLPGWDTHADNFTGHAELVPVLDTALSALIEDLQQRELLEHTVVMCCGEFGRTPRINPLEGRDHWPHGFTVALAGGPIRGGTVIGQTDPEGSRKTVDPQSVANIHATVLAALGIDYEQEYESHSGRPIKLCEGEPIRLLLA